MRGQAKVLFAVAALFAFVVLAGQVSASQQRLHLSSFGSFTKLGQVAVDQTGGEVYAIDLGDPFPSEGPPTQPTIKRYEADGNPTPFSALGSNAIDGSDAGSDADKTPANGFSFDSGSQLAVDSSGTATDGMIYVADSGNGVVDVFAPTGTYLGQLNGSGTPQGSFSYPCGVAVDPSGRLYVSNAFGEHLARYLPAGPLVEEADYDSQLTGVFGQCGIAADSTGAVYAVPSASEGSGPVTKYPASDFGSPSASGTEVDPSGTAVAVDQSGDDVFVDRGGEIAQYDSTGAPLATPFGAPQLSESRGLAANGASGRVYAAERSDSRVRAFGPLAILPDVVTGAASSLDQESATLNGSVDPDGVALSGCAFDYGTTTAYGQSAACVPAAASVPTGTGAVAVSADISGLDPGTVYHFRLRAANADGEVSGEDATLASGSGPQVQALHAGPVGETTATLAARVNSRNQPGTTYQFEWGATTSYGNSSPVSPVSLGSSDGAFHVVTEELTGLQPDTTYHFRVVADNPGGPAAQGLDRSFVTNAAPTAEPGCPNAEVREQRSWTHLSDCRAYEKVSPDDKNGFDTFQTGQHVTAPSGDRTVLRMTGPAVEEGAGAFDMMMASRDPLAGWSTRSIDPPSSPGIALFPQWANFSPDLTKGVVMAYSAITPDATEGGSQLYLRGAFGPGGSYDLLTPKTQVSPFHFPEPYVSFGGASADYMKFAYEAPTSQTGAPLAGNGQVYEWDSGEVRLVSAVDPDGPGPQPEEQAPQGARIGSGAEFTGLGVPGSVDHAVSADGARVFFTAIPGLPTNTGQIYFRENAATTVHVSASQRTDCAGDPTCGGDNDPDPAPDPAGPQEAKFLTAESEHGDRVLFRTCEKLTDDSNAFTTGGSCGWQSSSDLYIYDAGTGELEDLTTGDPNGARLLGFVGASDDLERIYFAAQGVLAAGAIEGESNLYLWEDGDIRFITVLRPVESFSGPFEEGWPVGDGDNWSETESDDVISRGRVSRTSPDGRHLLITSRERLTGYDNSGPACPEAPDFRCTEVYLYDQVEDRLTCVSCSASGAAPAGDANLGRAAFSFKTQTMGMRANLSDDGSRVFFDTPQSLSAEDTNGRRDVYLWQDGEVRLLSSGESSANSTFVDATPDGDDAFFLTRERLVDSDTDSFLDLYDARVDGGFSGRPPDVPPCEGDACLSPPVVPDDQTPGSLTHNGPGNSSAPATRRAKKRCGKERSLRRGRCVKKRHAPRKSHSRAANTTGRAGR